MNFQRQQKTKLQTPAFARDFQCIGGDCKLTCCSGWQVVIDKKTFRQYQADPDLSKNVTKKLGSISRSGETFGSLKSKPCGACAMLTEEGLCSVQIKLGEPALSKTCNTFPRSIFKYSNVEVKSYTPSCPEVARLVIASDKAMVLEEAALASGDGVKMHEFRKGQFSEVGLNLFSAIYNFIQTSEMLLWKKIICSSSLIKAFRTGRELTRAEYSAVLFQKQLEVEKLSLDYDTSIIQSEVLTPLIIHESFADRNNKPFFQLLLGCMHSLNFSEGASEKLDTIVKNFVLRREAVFKPSTLSDEKIWTNLFLSMLLWNMSKFSTNKESVEKTLDNITLWLSLVRFIYISTVDPEAEDAAGYLAYVTAVITRKTQHSVTLLKPTLKTLKEKYGDESALTALLVA